MSQRNLTSRFLWGYQLCISWVSLNYHFVSCNTSEKISSQKLTSRYINAHGGLPAPLNFLS